MPGTSYQVLRPICLAVVGAALAGCASDKAQPVSAQDFYARTDFQDRAVSPISPTARPGILHLPDAAAGSPPVGAQPRRGDSGPDLTQGEVQPFSSLQPTTAPDLTAALPSTMPSTMPVIEGDQYLTLGGVVMVVNGRPIFADKVLRRDINILREYARQMSLPEFEESARQQIERTVNELEGDELEIAAAERTLDPKDIQLAKILTAEWSKHQIGEAGGSEQVARIRADASGEDFQDQEDDKYHYYLTQLYYFKKIRPQIEIGPEDERRYYFAHIDEFTTPAQASIILIEADPADLNGNRQAAIDKLRDIRKRALGGEDFAGYARNQNDLPGAAGDGGNGGHLTLKPDTFVYSKVEAQVWKTPPGQISDVIEDHDAFFIFKVLSRDDGSRKSFADEAVQQGIYRHLFDIQLGQRRDAERRKLVLEEIVYTDPHMIDAAVDMAVQNYPEWSKK
ncbi:MAG TPA: peptidylprolyl isomerase [Tepidisphaeraceae bacterium]|nr:peptidylprolyl isomerase [Tepidisphaeraceae bacterium]